VFAPFTAAAKEETFSAFAPWSADECISAFEPEGKKAHQGVAPQNPALHQGITWSNSTTALGLRGARLENRIRSRCTGKERDSESGLDNFGARYNASSMGRFMSPDPLGGRMLDPQTLNKYAYVRNNPTTLIDPTGMYTCADQADCKSKQDIAFEKSRQQDLKSKDSDVVRAAKAYGDPTKDNGVGVKFGDPGKGRDAITSHGIGQDPNSPNGLRAEETVTVRSGLSGSALDAAVGHEGSHVADAQDFVNAITTAGGMDQSKNLSTYATELKAYMVTQSVLSSENEKRGVGDCGVDPCILGAGVMPAQAKDTINRLLANPANQYGAAPNYGVTPASPGPVLYPSLTTPK
jgi:RHS repeat-associated protein